MAVTTLEKLQQLRSIDVCSVDKDSLVDIEQIQIPVDLSRTEKAELFLTSIKNPYCYKQGDYVVKVNFNPKGGNITDKLKNYISKKASCVVD